MTYRRLFISLCLAGLFMLAGGWWSSLRYWSGIEISPPGVDTSVECVLYSGSLEIELNPYHFSSLYHTFVIPVEKLVLPKFIQYDPMGNFDRRKRRVEVAGGPARHQYEVRLPLWLIYLAFVAIAYLALRRPMRRQRLLEEQGASPSNSPSGE